ncbi:DUF2510 domain-containing protein [Kitasatospora sp. NPDC049258]|uniref:DUF2510 domain-containing protein n=1 Tax=Kitasatospora sp. NPDC049258 TaxID=3155394 RepID=UPI0034326E99
MTRTPAAPGRYQDPYGARALRWCDGARWTEHALAVPAPAEVPAAAEVTAPQAYGQQQPSPQPQFGGDHYDADFRHPLPEPLRTLAVAAMQTADTLLNPDANGDQ